MSPNDIHVIGSVMWGLGRRNALWVVKKIDRMASLIHANPKKGRDCTETFTNVNARTNPNRLKVLETKCMTGVDRSRRECLHLTADEADN